MNIVNKLTLRHMKENKRRTLVTILGVIISVSMITAVTTLGLSFLDVIKRDAIANNGNWHLKYTEVPADKLEVLKKVHMLVSFSLIMKKALRCCQSKGWKAMQTSLIFTSLPIMKLRSISFRLSCLMDVCLKGRMKSSFLSIS